MYMDKKYFFIVSKKNIEYFFLNLFLLIVESLCFMYEGVW